MADEIERKFLVKEMPDGLSGYEVHRIRQGYVSIGEDGTEVRLREKDGKFFLTVKSGGNLKRYEVEIRIGRKDFHALWPFTEGRRVEKLRYEIPYGPHVIELDVYSGRFEGLVTAEVEFESSEASAAFTPPKWIGKDITSDKRYKNKNLSRNGLPLDL
ncbi:MAG TPA: CYTH domain-containing protein [Thermodesulfobacteriota bacterium]|nr:CYTH domain-containing protein [Thermodesulfobacteriota bacterium]